jgi:hypothetical protein
VRATVREPILREFPEGDLDNVDVGENWMETRPLLGVNAGGALDDLDLGDARAPRRDVYGTFAPSRDIERGGRVSASAAQGDEDIAHGSVLGLDDEEDVKERVKKQVPPRAERGGAKTRQRKASPNASMSSAK